MHLEINAFGNKCIWKQMHLETNAFENTLGKCSWIGIRCVVRYLSAEHVDSISGKSPPPECRQREESGVIPAPVLPGQQNHARGGRKYVSQSNISIKGFIWFPSEALLWIFDTKTLITIANHNPIIYLTSITNSIFNSSPIITLNSFRN